MCFAKKRSTSRSLKVAFVPGQNPEHRLRVPGRRRVRLRHLSHARIRLGSRCPHPDRTDMRLRHRARRLDPNARVRSPQSTGSAGRARPPPTPPPRSPPPARRPDAPPDQDRALSSPQTPPLRPAASRSEDAHASSPVPTRVADVRRVNVELHGKPARHEVFKREARGPTRSGPRPSPPHSPATPARSRGQAAHRAASRPPPPRSKARRLRKARARAVRQQNLVMLRLVAMREVVESTPSPRTGSPPGRCRPPSARRCRPTHGRCSAHGRTRWPCRQGSGIQLCFASRIRPAFARMHIASARRSCSVESAPLPLQRITL